VHQDFHVRAGQQRFKPGTHQADYELTYGQQSHGEVLRPRRSRGGRSRNEGEHFAPPFVQLRQLRGRHSRPVGCGKVLGDRCPYVCEVFDGRAGARGVETVHVGYPDVHQHGIGTSAASRSDRFDARRSF
jgi:hypothetical protein